jgi:hypothetical protein
MVQPIQRQFPIQLNGLLDRPTLELAGRIHKRPQAIHEPTAMASPDDRGMVEAVSRARNGPLKEEMYTMNNWNWTKMNSISKKLWIFVEFS